MNARNTCMRRPARLRPKHVFDILFKFLYFSNRLLLNAIRITQKEGQPQRPQSTSISFYDGHELVSLPSSTIDFLPDHSALLNVTPGDPTVYAFTLE